MGIIENLRTVGEGNRDPRLAHLDRLKADYTAFANHAISDEQLAKRNTYQLFLEGKVFDIAEDILKANKHAYIDPFVTNLTTPESPLSIAWFTRFVGLCWLDFSGEYLNHIQVPVLHASSYSSADPTPDENTGYALPNGRRLVHRETLMPEQVRDTKVFLQRVALAIQPIRFEVPKSE